eukprot:jgi/Phyca11/16763/fgenesh1_pg.PHYCAscaffold_22_\
MTVTGEEQVSELGVERLGGTDAGLGDTGTGPARQGELSRSSTDEEEGVADPSTGVRTAAGRLSIRQALRGDLEAAEDDGGTEGSEHPPAEEDVKEEVKPEPRAQEEWMIGGGEECATGDHEEMGQYAEEEAFQGEYVTDPEAGREYDIDEYGRYYLSGYYGDAEEEEVKPPAPTSSGFIPLYTGAEKRRSDRPSTGWGWDPSRGAMQVQMVTVPSPTGVARMDGTVAVVQGELKKEEKRQTKKLRVFGTEEEDNIVVRTEEQLREARRKGSTTVKKATVKTSCLRNGQSKKRGSVRRGVRFADEVEADGGTVEPVSTPKKVRNRLAKRVGRSGTEAGSMWQPEEDGETVSAGTVADEGAERPERMKKVEKPVAVTSREVGTVTRNEDVVPGRTECTEGTDIVPGDKIGTVMEATRTVKVGQEVAELPVSARGYLLVSADGSPLRMGHRRASSDWSMENGAGEDQGTVDATTSEPERTIPDRAEATDVECLFTDAE